MDFVTFLSQLYGKGEETAHRLRSAGYTSPEKLCSSTPEKLSSATGLSVSSSKGIIATAKGMLGQDKKERKNRLVEIEGIGDRRAKKLREAGLRTVKAIALAKEEKLARTLNVPKSTASKIIKSAQKTGGSVPSVSVTAEETELLTTQVFPQKSSAEEESKASAQLAESFWQFG